MATANRICVRCVMDNSNPHIVFDENGVCNCCTGAFSRMAFEWQPNKEGRKRLDVLVERLRAAGRGRKYDAMIGLSGGVDSSYLAHVLRKEYDLRLLAVHVDGGWNTEISERNVKELSKALNIDLHTHVIDFSEMRDMQLAFLRASVLNQDIPQDHAFFSTLYRAARKFGIRDFLSGVNFSSECVTPPGWGYPSMDGYHVRAIHARFGRHPLITFPIMGVFEYLWMTRIRRQITIHRPLNYLDYDKEQAKSLLMDVYDYKDYGAKHNESHFTRFYQNIYLPMRYGFDKRRVHLSSQIVSGQISREAALLELDQPLTHPNQLQSELTFIADKLGITEEDIKDLIAQPLVEHENYPNRACFYRVGASIKSFLRNIK